MWNPLMHYFATHDVKPIYCSDADKKAVIKLNQRQLGFYPKKNVPITWRNVPSLLVCVMPIDLDCNEDASWTAMLIGHDRKGRRVEIWLGRDLAIAMGCVVGGETK